MLIKIQMSAEEKFWLEEPISLLKSTTLIPQCSTPVAARLNALTRLIIIITLILYFFCLAQWWLFLLLGLLLVIILYYLDQHKNRQEDITVIEHYTCRRQHSDLLTKEGVNKRNQNLSFLPYS